MSDAKGPEARGGRGRLRAALLAGLALAGAFACRTPARAAVVLSPSQQRRLGVEVEVLTAQRGQAKVNAFAKVLDTGPLAQLESDLESQEAAAAASSAEARRAQSLAKGDHGVSVKDMEAAIAQSKADQSKLTLLHRQLGLQWGPGIAGLPPARRQALVVAFSKGQAALVQLDTPDSAGQRGVTAAEVDIADQTVRATIIGPSRNAEPRLQSSGLLAVITGPPAILFSNGLTQSARLAQPGGQVGVVLPKSAILRFEGSDWAYVRSGAGFERRLIQDPQPQADGYFVGHGLRPGEAVAVKGVAALFAAERSPSTAGPPDR
jgi:hypothetical protein